MRAGRPRPVPPGKLEGAIQVRVRFRQQGIPVSPPVVRLQGKLPDHPTAPQGAERGIRERADQQPGKLGSPPVVLRRVLAAPGNVRRLEIAMDDAVRMGETDRLGDVGDHRNLVRQPQSRGGGAGALFVARLAQEVVECTALNPVHGEEAAPVHLAHVVDRDNPGMAQFGCQAGFQVEPLPRFFRRILFAEELEGDRAAELSVPRLPDHAHTARADALEQSVAPKRLARRPVAGDRSHGGRFRLRTGLRGTVQTGGFAGGVRDPRGRHGG